MLYRDDFFHLGDNYPAIGLAITRQLSKIICQGLEKANSDIITLFDVLLEEVAENGGIASG